MRVSKTTWLSLEVGQCEMPQANDELMRALSHTMLHHRGMVHAQDVSDRPEYAVHELDNVTVTYDAPTTMERAQAAIRPNLPWAEDHFRERVSGKPLNPAPSEAWWPFKKNGNAEHKQDEIFSHTYPERMWPKMAAGGVEWESSYGMEEPREHRGIRYEYGDLDDVVRLLGRDPFTRQAFLPIWFPEDTGSVDGQRVPCSLGFHFIRRGINLDCQYFMRSCDFFRHFSDDLYMSVRLLQWVAESLQDRERRAEIARGLNYDDGPYPFVGKVTMFISNLHCFKGDEYRFKEEK